MSPRPCMAPSDLAQALVCARAILAREGAAMWESRAKLLAMAGLCAAFPHCNKRDAARKIGFSAQGATYFASIAIARRRGGWWDEIYADEVCGALVVDFYGARAA